MVKDTTMWMVRAGEGARFIDMFKKKNIVALGFSRIGDISNISSVRGEMNIPENIMLQQNYPNPFNPTTAIEYSVTKSGLVTLEIFNFLGQKIKTLIQRTHAAGIYKAIWDGTDDQNQKVTSGIYFYQIITKDQVVKKKMLYIK